MENKETVNNWSEYLHKDQSTSYSTEYKILKINEKNNQFYVKHNPMYTKFKQILIQTPLTRWDMAISQLFLFSPTLLDHPPHRGRASHTLKAYTRALQGHTSCIPLGHLHRVMGIQNSFTDASRPLFTSIEWCKVESLGRKMSGSSRKIGVLFPALFGLNSEF